MFGDCSADRSSICGDVHWSAVSLCYVTTCTEAQSRYRFLIGFGLTFAGKLFLSKLPRLFDLLINLISPLTANAAPMLVTEISYPTYRAPLTSMYNSLWYSGSIM